LNLRWRWLKQQGDLKRGTIVIAEKAIFSVFPSDPSEKLSRLASKIKLRNWDPDPMSTRLARKAMTTISEHQVGGQIFNLHDHTAEILNRATKLPVLESPKDSTEVQLQHDFKTEPEAWYTINELLTPLSVENIIGSNQHQMEGVGLRMPRPFWDKKILEKTGLIMRTSELRPTAKALFYATSFMNHSCLDNTGRFTIGDFMFVYTTKDIHAGEELTTFYWSNIHPLSTRSDNARQYLFACHCSLCEYQTQESDKFRTVSLFADKLTTEKYITVPKLTAMINALKKVFGFSLAVGGLQYPVLARQSAFKTPLFGDPSREALISYLSATAQMYSLFVQTHNGIQQFSDSAKFRADFYVIAVQAEVAASDLVEMAFEIAVLCKLDRSGTISPEVTAAWVEEARMRTKDLFLQDDEVWKVTFAPILKDINALARKLGRQ
jgi:hypothetical protein